MEATTKRVVVPSVETERQKLIAQATALPRNEAGDYVFTKTCQKCATSFDVKIIPWAAGNGIFLKISLDPKAYCSPCFDAVIAERKAAELAERLRKGMDERTNMWAEMCPPIFRETIEERLPAAARHNLVKVACWGYNATGLLLAGPTGTGKTRLAYELCRRLHFDENRKVRIFTPSAFGHQCHKAYSKGGEGPDWADRIKRADVVFFDDFGKLRITDRVESELFGVIDERMTKGLPLIITTNMDAKSLEAGMSDDRGAALVRRLSECCELVAFE